MCSSDLTWQLESVNVGRAGSVCGELDDAGRSLDRIGSTGGTLLYGPGFWHMRRRLGARRAFQYWFSSRRICRNKRKIAKKGQKRQKKKKKKEDINVFGFYRNLFKHTKAVTPLLVAMLNMSLDEPLLVLGERSTFMVLSHKTYIRSLH